MSSLPYESALSRCPPEVWLRIFRAALTVPTAHECEDIMNSIGVDEKGFAAPRDELAPSMRNTVVSKGLALVLVCKSWRACVEPMLHEWLMIRSWGLLKNPEPLNRKISGRFIGSLVRRLDIDMRVKDGLFYTSTEFRDDADSLPPEETAHHGTQSNVIEYFLPRRATSLIELCPNIESFTWIYGWSSIVPRLERLPVTKLRSFAMSGQGQEMPLSSFADFLCSCPVLSVLEVGYCRFSSPPLWTHAAHETPRLALETVSILLTNSNSEFYLFMSSLALPRLRTLSLHKEFDDPQAGFNAILPLLDVIGKGLLSFAVHGLYDKARRLRELLTALSKCPCLQELVFETPEGILMPFDFANDTVRRVGLNGFFRLESSMRGVEPMRLDEHVEILRALMQTLCSPAFPRLEVVRLLDVVPRSIRGAHRQFEMDYVSLCEELLQMSHNVNLRVEDCLGNPISPDLGVAALSSTIMQEELDEHTEDSEELFYCELQDSEEDSEDFETGY